MREIKFRGREQDGFWTYGDLRHEGNITGIIENGIYSWVDSSTVGQFTGLLDSAGKEIYEGDIISIQGAFGATATIVKWLEGMWCVKKNLPLNHVTGIATVVGNVHDNPSLLERGEN